MIERLTFAIEFLGPAGLLALVCSVLVVAASGIYLLSRRGILLGVLTIGAAFLLMPIYYNMLVDLYGQLMYMFYSDWTAPVVTVGGYALLLVVMALAVMLFIGKRMLVVAVTVVLMLIGYVGGFWMSDRLLNYVQASEDFQNRLSMAKAQAAQATQLLSEQVSEQSAAISAEESQLDRADLTGLQTDEAEAMRKVIKQGQQAKQYLFKVQGKQEREAGRQRDRSAMTAAIHADAGQRLGPEYEQYLSVQQCGWGRKLERLVRYAGITAMVLLLLTLVLDYMAHFNQTFGGIRHLPLSGRVLDWLYGKSHAVWLQSNDLGLTRHLLADLTARGETFIFMGREDPTEGQRLWYWPWLVPMPVLKYDANSADYHPTLIFDGAWFGRYAFCLIGPKLVGPYLGELLHRLRLARRSLAVARRTVNLVIDIRKPIDASILDELVFLCRRTNMRLIVLDTAAPGNQLAGQFDEIYDEKSCRQLPVVKGSGPEQTDAVARPPSDRRRTDGPVLCRPS